MNEDLFQPSLQADGVPVYAQKPWSQYAQFVVAFFGGTLAIAVFAYQNSLRLQLNDRDKRNVLLLGVAGVVLSILCAALVGLYFADAADPTARANTRIVRYLNQGLAIIASYLIYRNQRSSYRVYNYASDGDYDSPWVMGLLSVLILGIVQGFVLSFVFAVAAGVLLR